MSGLIVALVDVSVVHGDDVHVAEDKAVVVIVLLTLGEAHVHQFASVERCGAPQQKRTHTTHTRAHAHTHTHPLSHTHTHIHTHTHTHTHTHREEVVLSE